VALVAATLVAVAPTSAEAKGVKTEIVVGDFTCYESAPPTLVCSGSGGLNSNKDTCASRRKMEVRFNGTKVASTKSDATVHYWDFDSFTIPGPGSLAIVAPAKHTRTTSCKKAKRSYTVDAQGNLEPDRAG